jgi:single-strand DNA-binding protein
MASVNRVILIGNLTRDPQLKYLPSQTAVVEFGLAMNRKFKDAAGQDREEACFVECSAFGRPAEVINQYCQKGKMLYVEGRLKFDQWEDKQGGGKRSKLHVVVENFQFLGGRDSAGGGGGSSGGGEMSGGDEGQSARPPAPARPAARYPQARSGPGSQQSAPPAQSQAPQPPFNEDSQVPDSDIPF